MYKPISTLSILVRLFKERKDTEATPTHSRSEILPYVFDSKNLVQIMTRPKKTRRAMWRSYKWSGKR